MSLCKLAAPILLTACLFGKVSFCQSSRLTLTEKNASLDKVLDEIHQKTGYSYFGEGNWPRLSYPVTFSVKNATLTQVLDSCFKDQPLTYKLLDKTIAIIARPEKTRTVHGFVYNESHEPLEGVTVSV